MRACPSAWLTHAEGLEKVSRTAGDRRVHARLQQAREYSLNRPGPMGRGNTDSASPRAKHRTNCERHPFFTQPVRALPDLAQRGVEGTSRVAPSMHAMRAHPVFLLLMGARALPDHP
jgi:hypothetical protein